MNFHRHQRRFGALFLALSLNILSAFGAPALPAGNVAIVVHPDVPVQELTVADLRKIFMGDRQYWTKRLRVRLILRGRQSWERDLILKTVYRMTEAQFRSYWVGKVFRAEIAATPRTVDSNAAAIAAVSKVPGSITFVDAREITDTVKVVKIIRPYTNPDTDQLR